MQSRRIEQIRGEHRIRCDKNDPLSEILEESSARNHIAIVILNTSVTIEKIFVSKLWFLLCDGHAMLRITEEMK